MAQKDVLTAKLEAERKKRLAKADKLRLLKRWKAVHDRCDTVWVEAKPLFGDDATGSPLWDAQWTVFEAYTDTLATLLGDGGGWLDWFANENEMGKRQYEAGPKDKLRPIRTLSDLLWLLEVAA